MANKIFKKVVAAAMAVAMAAGMAVSAMAIPGEDTIDTAKTSTMTIVKYDLTAAQEGGYDPANFTANGEKDDAAQAALEDYALKGVEFTYLRVGDINTSTEAGKLKLLYDIPAALETILGLNDASHNYMSDQLNAALAGKLADNTATKNALEDYVTGNGGTAMALTNNSGSTTAKDLRNGLYLVVETKVPEDVHTTTDPFFVSLPMTTSDGEKWNYDVTVYPKNQTNNPTVDKLVTNNTEEYNINALIFLQVNCLKAMIFSLTKPFEIIIVVSVSKKVFKKRKP